MKKLLLLLFTVFSCIYANAQCTTTNATACRCKDSTQTDCDLLPDIELGHPPFYLLNQQFGVVEFSQSGNGDDDGRLKVTVSTPNTGFGPLELGATNVFVCGTDTIVGTPPTFCPDGITFPRIEINQRIYHKNAGSMTYYDRFAGTMTYHPAHGHMHVDNWGTYTLRQRDSTQADPLQWPLIGTGSKLAFCVEDYGKCSGYPGHCLDSSGNALNNNTDFPNYGLGGGHYGCSAVYQGISSGYVDIYWTTLEGMWIDLPDGLCNGDYWIVCQVDPNNNFLEEDETNNVYAAPFTLIQQRNSMSQAPLYINSSNLTNEFCQGESITLSAGSGMPDNTYMWSNGETTKSITVSTVGTYTVQVNSRCGAATSVAATVTSTNPPAGPTVVNDTIPNPGNAVLSASSSFPVKWYDQPTGGTYLGSGNLLNTPVINTSTTFYAEDVERHNGAVNNVGLPDTTAGGTGGFLNGNQSLIFDCLSPFILHSVVVYSNTNQNLVVQLTQNGAVLDSVITTLVPGANTVILDMTIRPGTDYNLTRSGSPLLYRNNNAVNNLGYPFRVANICKIKNSSQGTSYYYYFYNWEIMPYHDCVSPRIPVQAVVLNPVSTADFAFKNSIAVYPNPANSSLTVSFNGSDKDCEIQLINGLGQIILRRKAVSGNGSVKETLDVSQVSKGVYNIHILSSGKNYYHKVVIN